MKILTSFVLALVLVGCNCKMTYRDAYHVQAIGRDMAGKSYAIDFWYDTTKPLKQSDGTTTFHNNNSNSEVTLPVGVEVIVEKYQAREE